MRIALIGIGKIANYQMQAITHTGVFANLAEMYACKEDNKELSEVLHRLLFAALR
jgi:hypothetical protein